MNNSLIAIGIGERQEVKGRAGELFKKVVDLQ